MSLLASVTSIHLVNTQELQISHKFHIKNNLHDFHMRKFSGERMGIYMGPGKK